MKPQVEQLLLDSVYRDNLLPITSGCNTRCIFCSNPQNPPDVETYQIPPLNLTKVSDLLEFIDPTRKVVIGEAASRINEGEPLTHPNFKEILLNIRRKYPSTLLQVTTNGILLTPEMARFLADIGNVELNISINAASLDARGRLMGNRDDAAVKSLPLLAKLGLSFHGSIVAMPHVTGWNELARTIHLLGAAGALTTRIFLPAYTRWAAPTAVVPDNLWPEIRLFIQDLRQRNDMPLVCEPPELLDLRAVVEGIILGSAAAEIGLAIGDEITEIEGQPVFCRVDAFTKLKNITGKVQLTVRRRGSTSYMTMVKAVDQAPGVVLNYDVNPELFEAIKTMCNRKGYNRVLLLVSKSAQKIIEVGLNQATTDIEFVVKPVPNRYFGGNIQAAGLLVNDDFSAAIDELGDQIQKFDAVFLPAIPYDRWGRDLKGNSYTDLAENLSVNLEIVR